MKELRNLEMEIKTMKKTYIKPTIEIIHQEYNEGLMQDLSMPQGGTSSGTTGFSKPGGEWGDTWTEPETDDTW